jgi:two-component system response regulator HydG
MIASTESSILYNNVTAAAKTNKRVLLCGGNDIGKDCVAEAIHFLSSNKTKPLLIVESSRQADKISVELVSPIKRDITEILHDKEWLLDSVGGSTVYLRKLSNLDENSEQELFEVFESADIRIIENAVKSQSHPLCDEGALLDTPDVHIINVPALRNRKEDINFFAHYFLEQANEEWNKQVKGFRPEFIQALHSYSWPRNLQQLKEVIRQAMFLTQNGEVIEADFLPEEIRTATTRRPSIVLRDIASRAEYELILDALKQCRYNKKQAAKMLNISRKTLYSKLKKATSYN